MKCLRNLDAVLQKIYKLLQMELQISYFVVGVSYFFTKVRFTVHTSVFKTALV